MKTLATAKSSFISKVAYGAATRTLQITIGDKVYNYYDVPPHIAGGFTANSIGSYYNRRVKGNYVAHRVDNN